MSRRHTSPNIPAAVVRLQEAAKAAASELLPAADTTSADRELLELCEHALYWLTQERRALEAIRSAGGHYLDPKFQALQADHDSKAGKSKPFLRQAAKLPATTAAGIYAKALCVRASRSGAPGLGVSLAADLLANRELRRGLWPAEAK